jgi:hypothetical protein
MFCFGCKEQLMLYSIFVLCFTMNCVIFIPSYFLLETRYLLFTIALCQVLYNCWHGKCLDHLPWSHIPLGAHVHLVIGLGYLLICTFRETTNISVGFFLHGYYTNSLISVILSTSDFFFFFINTFGVKSKTRMHLQFLISCRTLCNHVWR